MHELHTTYVRNYSSPSRNSRRYVYISFLSLCLSLYQFSLFLYIIYYIYIVTLYTYFLFSLHSLPPFFSVTSSVSHSQRSLSVQYHEKHTLMQNGLTKPKGNRKKSKTERKIEQTIKKDRKEIGQEKKNTITNGMSREANDVKLDVSPTFRRAIELWCRMYL